MPGASGWHRAPTRPTGFSFVEVLVVVALLAILLVAAIPQLLLPDELDVELVARQVGSDLGVARRLAIARRQRFTLTFSPAGGPYTSYTLTDAAGNVQPGFPKELPPSVTGSGTGQVAFRPNGTSIEAALITFTAGGAAAEVRVLAATGRILISGP